MDCIAPSPDASRFTLRRSHTLSEDFLGQRGPLGASGLSQNRAARFCFSLHPRKIPASYDAYEVEAIAEAKKRCDGCRLVGRNSDHRSLRLLRFFAAPNFKTVDESLFKELETLTARGCREWPKPVSSRERRLLKKIDATSK